jgi:hypothetical protein
MNYKEKYSRIFQCFCMIMRLEENSIIFTVAYFCQTSLPLHIIHWSIDGQTDRQTDGQTDRQTYRQTKFQAKLTALAMCVKFILVVMRGHGWSNGAVWTLMNLTFLLELQLLGIVLRLGLHCVARCSGSKDVIIHNRSQRPCGISG